MTYDKWPMFWLWEFVLWTIYYTNRWWSSLNSNIVLLPKSKLQLKCVWSHFNKWLTKTCMKCWKCRYHSSSTLCQLWDISKVTMKSAIKTVQDAQLIIGFLTLEWEMWVIAWGAFCRPYLKCYFFANLQCF